MAGENYPDSVLTGDEEELVTMINGLKAQAANLQTPIKKAQKDGLRYGAGTASALALYFFEGGNAAHNFEKGTYLSIATAMAIGGLTQVVRELRMTKQIGQKNRRADELRHELDPAGTGQFDDVLYYSAGNE